MPRVAGAARIARTNFARRAWPISRDCDGKHKHRRGFPGICGLWAATVLEFDVDSVGQGAWDRAGEFNDTNREVTCLGCEHHL
jgi:hypothetical protein